MSKRRPFSEISAELPEDKFEAQKIDIIKSYKPEDGPAKELVNPEDKSICCDLIKQVLLNCFDCEQFLNFQDSNNYEIGFHFKNTPVFDLGILTSLTRNFSQHIEKMNVKYESEESVFFTLLCMLRKKDAKKRKTVEVHTVNSDNMVKTVQLTKDQLMKDNLFAIGAPVSLDKDLYRINQIVEDVFNMDKHAPVISFEMGLIKKSGLIMYNMKFEGIEEIKYPFLIYFMNKYEDAISEATFRYDKKSPYMNIVLVPLGSKTDSVYKTRKE